MTQDAATLRCPSCGAPAPEGAVRCPYCRSTLATVACPSCFGLMSLEAVHCPHCGGRRASKEGLPSGLECPGCKGPLHITDLDGVPFQTCPACGGLWMGHEPFRTLAEDRDRRASTLNLLGAPDSAHPGAAPVSYRPCPTCKKLMNRQNYARISGVVLDQCKDHGLWFDADELRRVLAFIQGGGLDRARTKQIQAAEEAQRQANQAKLLEVAAPSGTAGGSEPTLEGALFGFVSRFLM